MTNFNLSYEGPKYQANYSHVDLHIELDDRIDVASMLNNISFTSYQFSPSLIMDKNYNLIANVNDALVAGNPTSTFSFDRKEINANLSSGSEQTLVNPAQQRKILPKIWFCLPGDPNNFTISKDLALALASSGESLLFKGYIDGILEPPVLMVRFPEQKAKT